MTAIAEGWVTPRRFVHHSAYRPVKVRPIEPWTSRDIYRLRMRLGVSQATMAEMLGVSRVSLTRWEHGTETIGRASVRRLLSLLDAAPELFMREPR
ncbi:MAG: helix-turn-helix domain-containing protein [Dehalococcoidia bacterium]